MKMLIAKLCTIVLCLGLSSSLSSCYNQQDSSRVDDSYLAGIEQGKQDIFVDLWNASSNVVLLHCGDSWKTEHFTLEINNKRKTEVSYYENAPYIEFDLTLNDSTIEECFENDKMFFNIYSYSEGSWSQILGYDNYYDYAILQHLVGNNARADVRIYDDTKYLAVIIVIDSCIYTASYSL